MRVKKLLKVTVLTVLGLVILSFALVASFIFNPLEASLPSMRDVVPRGVDFFLRKANLSGDFEGVEDSFPEFPDLAEVVSGPAWKKLQTEPFLRQYQGDIKRTLAEVRRIFLDLKQNGLNLLDDVLGAEVQVAGMFSKEGLDRSYWCAYFRGGWRSRAGYGLLRYGMVQTELAKQGIALEPVGEFYKVSSRNFRGDIFVTRYRDCFMISNDPKGITQADDPVSPGLLKVSLELAHGSSLDLEPLGSSSHYIDGVSTPVKDWKQLTGVKEPNSLEIYVRPDRLLDALLPGLRNWPDPHKQDSRNERMIASFLNLDSWRFLSGSLIFEPRSLSLLTHLVVNSNKHSTFQREFFKTEAQPRKEWMESFFNLVPADVCAVTAMRMPAGEFLREMYSAALDRDEKDVLNSAFRRIKEYKNVEDLINKMQIHLRPRIGVLFRPNRRSKVFKETFEVFEESPMPQWAWVLWWKKSRSGRPMNKPFAKFVNLLNEHRAAFGFTGGWTLPLDLPPGDQERKDVAYEFPHRNIPGTGAMAICTYSEFFIVSNSGPFIRKMVQAYLGKTPSIKTREDFREFEKELPQAVNGLLYLWSDQLQEVLSDVEKHLVPGGTLMDQAWALSARPRTRNIVFRRNWQSHGTPARIPAAQRSRFKKEVEQELDRQWDKESESLRAGDLATVRQAIHLSQTFRSAYLQCILDSQTLSLTFRALAPDYNQP